MSDPENSGKGGMRAERRKHPRKKPQALVYLDLGPSNGGMVRDVSEGGIGFRAVAPMRAGQKVTFAFAFDGATRLEGECELVWTDEDGKAGGLRFTEISSELREAVRKRIAGDSIPEQPVAEASALAATPLASIDDIRREIRQPSGAARRLARMLAEPPPAELTKPVRKEPATPAAMLLPRAPEVVEEIKPQPKPEIQPETLPAIVVETTFESIPEFEPDFRPQIKPDVKSEPSPEPKPPTQPELKPDVGPEITPLVRPESRPAVWPTAPLMRAAAVRVSAEAMESSDEEMPGARWLDEVTLGRAIAFMLVLTLLAGGYVYHRAFGESLIWLGQQIAGEESPATQIAAPPVSAPPAAVQSPAESPAATKTEPEPERVVETPKQSAQVPTPAPASQPATIPPVARESSPLAPTAQPPKNEGNGQPEFLQALQILRGKNHSGQLPEAVRLLWVAVEKGNSGAEVALADLYRRGEGMPQNCDQTRILLTAAVKKGNNEARNRIAQLNQEGCP